MKREYDIEIPYNPRTPLPRRIKETVDEIQRQVTELGFNLWKFKVKVNGGVDESKTQELKFRGFGPGVVRYELIDHGGRSGVHVVNGR